MSPLQTAAADDSKEPEFLYRYRPLTGYAREDVERILAHGQIRFSSPAHFNDPFDCKVSRVLDVPEATKEIWLRERICREILACVVSRSGVCAQVPSNLDEQVEQRFQKLWACVDAIARDDLGEIQRSINYRGVLPLSEPWDDILMWSHYADGHKGICLKFRRCALKFPHGHLKSPPYQNAFYKPEKVRYSEPYPAATLIQSKPWEIYSDWLMTKSCHWSYEQEWRVILQPEKTADSNQYGWKAPSEWNAAYGRRELPPDSLAEVIFGCEIKPEDKQEVREWLKMGSHRQVPVSQARKKLGRFELELSPES